MNNTTELLEAMHKSAEMGKGSLDKLITHIDDPAFKTVIASQAEDYNRIYMSCDALIKGEGGDDRGIPPIAKAMSGMMMDVKGSIDSSTENLAKMALKGTQMGINELDDALRTCPTSDQGVINLAREFSEMLERNKKALERYTES